MVIQWAKLLPVFVSIGVIITVAIAREYSRTFAAIAAVMPINIPLGMWIVTAGQDDPQAALAEFSEALLINIVPTLIFMVVAWQMTRAGFGLVPTIFGGYVAWGIALGLVFFVRQLLIN